MAQEPIGDLGSAWQQAMDAYSTAMKAVQTGFAAAAAAAAERRPPAAAGPDGSGSGRQGERADPAAGSSSLDPESEDPAPGAPEGGNRAAGQPFRQADRYAIARVAEQLDGVTRRLERVEVLLAEALAAQATSGKATAEAAVAEKPARKRGKRHGK